MADEGFGSTITFQSGFCAEVISISVPGISRKAIDTTHMTTTAGWMTFRASDLKNQGELKVSLLFDPNATPPIDQAAETVRVTFPIPTGQSTGAYFTCSGFMTDFSITDPHDDRMTADATIKYSGQPTWVDSA